MSHTGSTTNYNLSQFVGTDKPAWLTDYNGDMTAIDAQMKLNSTAATTAGTNAGTALTNIGTLTDLTTSIKTSAVAAINEVDAHADTAQATANSASSTASAASASITALTAYLGLTNTAQISSANISISAGSINQKEMSYASNAAGTLGKLYGYLYGVTIPSASTITISSLPFSVSEEFAVKGLITAQDAASKTIYYPSITFKTNGTATISFPSNYGGLTLNLYFACSLLFMQNFGD